MNPERAVAYRKQVGVLLEALLNDEISSRTALNCWPAIANEDSSIRAAYAMLWFFEADEDRHHQETFYSDVQLETLKIASRHLKQGESLPPRLLQEYRQVAAPPTYDPAWVWREPLWWLREKVRLVVSILDSNPQIAELNKKQSVTTRQKQFTTKGSPANKRSFW